MNYEEAHTLMTEGKGIARAAWHWISVQMDGPEYVLVTQDGCHQPGWTPSQDDKLTTDWVKTERR